MARRARNGVIYSGPFFEADPAKRIGQNIAALVKELTGQTTPLIRAEFTPGHGSELASTIAEKFPPRIGRTYLGVVFSTMSGMAGSPNPKSWVTWDERGRRRSHLGFEGEAHVHGPNVQSATFRGFGMWARVQRAARARIKEEKIRLGVIKGVA